MKNKKLFIILAILILIIILITFFCLNKSKPQKIGNNSSSQEIVDYILNISSYEAEIEVQVESNKNQTKYLIHQSYVSPNI